jgi:hypothetical protein
MSIHCPACGSVGPTAFFEASSVPVFCNVLWENAEQARSAPRGRIELYICPECRLVFNGAFEPSLLEYSPRYENSLHCSPHFQEFADALARRLVDRFGLHEKVVLEVGCGRAEFLAMLAALGANRGIGFDQSYDPTEEPPDAGAGTLEIKQTPFPASTDGLMPALTLSRHVLEHIPDPRPFVEAMVSVAGRRRGGGIYVEVPNVLYTLRDLGIWDIIYEHCSYYSVPSLTRLLTDVRVNVTAAFTTYGEQFLGAEGVVDGGVTAMAEDGTDWDALIPAFSRHQREKVAEWAERLEAYRCRGERVALWGAGSKGVTFLNLVPGSDVVGDVVDLNPRKHGRFTAGTGHEIRSPATLQENPPAAVLVMNPLYVDEIGGRLAELGLRPSIEVV